MEIQKLSFARQQNYEILLGIEILPEIVTRLSRMGFNRRCMVITNDVVAKWYLEPLLSELRQRGFEVEPIILGDGEPLKSLETVNSLYPRLLKFGLDRKSPIIALGGGVIGDLAGFVAATFERGVPFIQLPTSLLAMVDASIGGKVAVNLPEGKNLVGSFYQPSLVGIDLNAMKTLPLTQVAYGLVECIKHGAIADAAYYKFILKNRQPIKDKEPSLMQRLVRRSLNIKKIIVEEDELEKGRRAILNFGHTFGHALEALGEYRRFHHGEAVGLGMLMAIEAAREMQVSKEDFRESLELILGDFSLPTRLSKDFEPGTIFEAMLRDKKRQGDKINLILPLTLGSVQITPIPIEELKALLPAVLMNLYQ